MRRGRRSSVLREWTVVRLRGMCAFGHPLHGGEMALYVRRPGDWFFLCGSCARAQYGMEPPSGPAYQPTDADSKARSAGDV